jgi:hypothetical protein
MHSCARILEVCGRRRAHYPVPRARHSQPRAAAPLAAPAPRPRRAPRRGLTPRAAAGSQPQNGDVPGDAAAGRPRIPGPAALADLASRLAPLLGRGGASKPAAAPAGADVAAAPELEGALRRELGAWAASVASADAAPDAPATPHAAEPRPAAAGGDQGRWAASTAALVASLAALPSRDAPRLCAAWSDVLAGSEISPSHGGAVPLTAAGRDAALAGVLAAVLRRLPLAAGAAHVAAVAWQLPPARAAHVARTLMVLFEAEHAASRRAGHPAWAAARSGTSGFSGVPDARTGAAAWMSMLSELSLPRPALAAAPPALRMLCAAAAALGGDALPTYMSVAAAAAAEEAAIATTPASIIPGAPGAPEAAALQLLYSCMAGARDATGLQLLLRRLARQLPPVHAAAMRAALGHRLTPETAEVLSAAAAGRAGAAAAGATTPDCPAEEALPAEAVWRSGAGADSDAQQPDGGGGPAAAAALALRLLSGPAADMRTLRLMLPALGRAYARGGAAEGAAFARAAAAGLPRLPADRAATGLVLLQPALAAAGALTDAALAVAAVHGAAGAAAAVEAEWFAAEAAEAAGWAAAVSREAVHDVLWALEAAGP